MKATIQRCKNAQVSVNGEVISKIGQGACIFIGISSKDDVNDLEFMVQKLLSLELFDDENGKKWKKSVMDKEFEVLCISQFTLYNAWKANKPGFYNPMPAENTRESYEKFIQMLKDKYNPNKIKVNEEVPVSIEHGICVLVGFHKDDTLKDLEYLHGNTPDFHKTMGGDKSQELYTKLIELARDLYVPEKVKDGVFGIYRQIYIENDGPVTFEIDSPPSCREEVVTV